MILPIYPNYITLSSLSLLLFIIDKHCKINLGKSWKKLESDLIIRNTLNFKSDLIFRNKGSILHKKNTFTHPLHFPVVLFFVLNAALMALFLSGAETALLWKFCLSHNDFCFSFLEEQSLRLNFNFNAAENQRCMSSMQRQCHLTLLQLLICRTEFHMAFMPSLWQRLVLINFFYPSVTQKKLVYPSYHSSSFYLHLTLSFSLVSMKKAGKAS